MNADAVAIPHETLEPTPPPAAERFDSFAEGLLGGSESTSWAEGARRLGVGLGLSALFGGALGLRAGGAAIPLHAAGVTAGILSVAAVSVPAFAIILALVNAPIDGEALGRATARSVAKTGLLLGGLAPAAALYVLTVEDAMTVTLVGFGGLLLAGAIALQSFAKELSLPLREAPARTQIAMTLAMPAFLIFSAALAARVWWLALPILAGGAR